MECEVKEKKGDQMWVSVGVKREVGTLVVYHTNSDMEKKMKVDALKQHGSPWVSRENMDPSAREAHVLFLHHPSQLKST